MEKKTFSMCTCIYYDVHLAHLRVRSLDFRNGWFFRRLLFKGINFKNCVYLPGFR